MIAVLFEADAVPKHQARYLQLAGELRPELDNVKGFISIERFQSLSTQGKNPLTFPGGKTKRQYSNGKKNMRHQAAQKEGQKTIFSHYRIRVANVLREYSSGNWSDPNV
ncbi:antibiotic biosynthesis monooxygenase [Salmonella enterica]|nr:antibiotic biosynthesis monooxygenase [Salmonella enterica]